MKRAVVALGASPDPASADARMAIEVYGADAGPRDRLALVLHGRQGSAHAPHMLKLIRAYLGAGYVVAAPDCPGSDFNASAGGGGDFTIDRLVRDAGRAAALALADPTACSWRGGVLALCGHSMGAYAAACLAAGPLAGRAAHLTMVSPFTSGIRQLTARRRYHPDGLAMLARELPGALDDWPRHDIFAFVGALRLPTAVVAGARDTIAPLENVRELAYRLRPRPRFVVLPAAAHCLEGGRYAREFGDLLAWLDGKAGVAASR